MIRPSRAVLGVLALAALAAGPAGADEKDDLSVFFHASPRSCRTNLTESLRELANGPRRAAPPPLSQTRSTKLHSTLAIPAITVLDGSCFQGNCPAKFSQSYGSYDIYDIDTIAAASRFYQSHPDTKDGGWDEVVFFTTFFTTEFGGAYYMPISNDVKGIAKTAFEGTIGAETFNMNERAGTGSAGFLKGTVLMSDWHSCKLERLLHVPCDSKPPYDGSQESNMGILAQEVGHRWGAELYFMDEGRKSDELLGRDLAHWSYYVDTGGSPMEGNSWNPSATNRWDLVPVSAVHYGLLDQYAMGLRDPSEVTPTLVVRTPQPPPCTTNKTDPNTYTACSTNAATSPGQGIERVSGTARMVGIDEIVQSEGPRVPAFADSQRIVHLAFSLLDLPSSQASDAEVVQLDNLRRAFTRAFYDGTDRRMRAVTTLSRRDDLGLFDWTLDGEGWTLDSDITASAGMLLVPLSGTSGISHTNLELDANRESMLHLKLTASRNAPVTLRLAWSTDATNVPAGQTLDIPVPASGHPTMLEVPMTGRPGWTGFIQRMDLTVVPKSALPGEVDLDSLETASGALFPDTDGDLVPDNVDNCPKVANTNQLDSAGDGTGDACRPAPPAKKGCGCAGGLDALGLVALAGLLARRRR